MPYLFCFTYDNVPGKGNASSWSHSVQIILRPMFPVCMIIQKEPTATKMMPSTSSQLWVLILNSHTLETVLM